MKKTSKEFEEARIAVLRKIANLWPATMERTVMQCGFSGVSEKEYAYALFKCTYEKGIERDKLTLRELGPEMLFSIGSDETARARKRLIKRKIVNVIDGKVGFNSNLDEWMDCSPSKATRQM